MLPGLDAKSAETRLTHETGLTGVLRSKEALPDYRIIYDVDDTTRTVTVAVVGYRREVYKGLDL